MACLGVDYITGGSSELIYLDGLRMGKLGVRGFDSGTLMFCRGWQYRRFASIQAGISLDL